MEFVGQVFKNQDRLAGRKMQLPSKINGAFVFEKKNKSLRSQLACLPTILVLYLLTTLTALGAFLILYVGFLTLTIFCQSWVWQGFLIVAATVIYIRFMLKLLEECLEVERINLQILDD